ncbi:MAG: FumA C-terminus/TtdB family hydratase beta subunit [Defluviitaleaceae bacterium]|nr:FumA C-terminus/TtdB family hydratase beta subunit [Defluviitaleaceae bacterium]
MSEIREIFTPLDNSVIESLVCGEMIHITGEVYTARDAAHKRLCEMLERGEAMPFDFAGNIVFYAGPCPAPPGKPIGSVGPTSAPRMDAYAPILMAEGLKVMIGKGIRNQAVRESIVEHKGVYFTGIGGAAAYIAQCVQSADLVTFEDLGTEAIRRLKIIKMPVIVAIDSRGKCIYDR